MIVQYLLLVISLLTIKTQSGWMFCWATCSKNSCSNTTFDKCTGCPTGLAKDTNTLTTKFVAPIYTNL